jgi:hypothetical protein
MYTYVPTTAATTCAHILPPAQHVVHIRTRVVCNRAVFWAIYMHVQPIHPSLGTQLHKYILIYDRLSFFNNTIIIINKPHLISFCYAVGFKQLLEIDFQEYGWPNKTAHQDILISFTSIGSWHKTTVLIKSRFLVWFLMPTIFENVRILRRLSSN